MPILPNYHHFAGRHYETGTIHNALAYQGVTAPHTGHAPSEALLMGISGGAAFGYFTFEYGGYLPHLILLTRNTFSPLETLLERLAIPQEVYRTDNAKKGEANLIEVLESGRPAVIWADMLSLPYNDLAYDEHNWAMIPMIAYGLRDGIAHLADRSGKPLQIPADVLSAARGRVKKDEFRVVMLDTPDWKRLPAAVTQGIWQCISLFTEAPPKGKRDNFGLAALENWAAMLTNTRNKQSWARYFPPGERMWMALVGDALQAGAFGAVDLGAGNSAERGLYADFLDEAAVILERPALRDAAQAFRASEEAWAALADLLLPDDIALFSEAKTLRRRKRTLFIERGGDALTEIQAIHARLHELQAEAAANFPLNETQAADYRAGLAEQVLRIRDAEHDAIQMLKSAMA